VQVDERIEAATLSLLGTGGPAAVTVEAVAQESGVARTTICRRYTHCAELLTTVLGHAIGTPELPPACTVRDKIRFALQETWRQMSDVLGPGGVSAIVMDADTQSIELFRAALRPYSDSLVALIAADSREGLLRPDVDADGTVSLFLGAYLGELVRRGRVDDDWLDRCLDMMWLVLAVPAR
jgi:AcrR family transcriptional regulator